MEDLYKALYSDGVEIDAEIETLLLQGYDRLSNPLTEQIESGTYDEESALLAAEPVFAALEIRLEDALKNAESYIPSSNDLGVDIVSTKFEVGVVLSLEHHFACLTGKCKILQVNDSRFTSMLSKAPVLGRLWLVS